MKTTKKQALDMYDRYHGVLRNLNGGTMEENERSAPHCYERLQEIAAEAEAESIIEKQPYQVDRWSM